MTSKSAIRDVDLAEESDHDDNDIRENKNTHPRISAKKTFFDIHRDRRRVLNVIVSESDVSFHPRIHWSAGMTDVGSRHQSRTDAESPILDPTRLVLRSEVKETDLIYRLEESKRILPSVPDTWGPTDAQPTQPEDVERIVGPSGAIVSENNSPESNTKSRRKFLHRFRKHALAIAAAKRLKPKILEKELMKDDIETYNPEEEFQQLNESYVRDGIIRIDDLAFISKTSKKKGATKMAGGHWAEQPTVKRTGSGLNVSSDVRNHDKDISKADICVEDTNDNVLDKNSAISASPLPVRRSCQPLDVTTLRKLRDMASKPGTSSGTNEIVDDDYTSKTPRISIFENDKPTNTIENILSDSEESLDGMRKDPELNKDPFKIENPFSDFSLQTTGRERIPFKSHLTSIKDIPLLFDTTQPGTSRDSTTMDAYRRKVSLNAIIEQPEDQSREQSPSQFTQSSMLESSFSAETLMTDCVKETLDATKKSQKEFADESVSKCEIDLVGNIWCRTIPSILRTNFICPNILFIHEKIAVCTGAPVRDSCDRNFDHFLTTFKEVIEILTFEQFLQKCLSNLTPALIGSRIYFSLLVRHQISWPESIMLSRSTYPINFPDVIRVSRSPNLTICMDYTEVQEEDEFCRIAKALKSQENQKMNLLVFLSKGPDHSMSVRTNLIEKITGFILDTILQQHLRSECLFSAFHSTIALKAFNVWSFQSIPRTHSNLIASLKNTPFVIFFEKFFNPYEMSKGR